MTIFPSVDNLNTYMPLVPFILMAILAVADHIRLKSLPVLKTPVIPHSLRSSSSTPSYSIRRRLAYILLAINSSLFMVASHSATICEPSPVLVVLLDTSVSMCANDYFPNRFTYAIQRVKRIIRESDFDLVAIYTFNNSATRVLPPASREIAIQTLESLTHNVQFGENTAIGRAALLALKDITGIDAINEQNSLLKKLPPNALSSNPTALWTFLVVTDGVNNTGPTPSEIAPLFLPPTRAIHYVLITPKSPSNRLNCPASQMPESYQIADTLLEEEIPTPEMMNAMPSEISQPLQKKEAACVTFYRKELLPFIAALSAALSVLSVRKTSSSRNIFIRLARQALNR